MAGIDAASVTLRLRAQRIQFAIKFDVGFDDASARVAGFEGEKQFVSNFVTVHTRTAFVDGAENPARQRHLLRLWISRPETGRPLCPEYAAWRTGYPT